MLRYVAEQASPRKLRLFVCACVRRIWPWLRSDASRQAVEEMERQADGRRSLTPTRAMRELARRGAVAAEEARQTALAVRQEADQRRGTVWGSVWVGDPPPPSILVHSAAQALESHAGQQEATTAAQAAELIVSIADGTRGAAETAEAAAQIVVAGRLAAFTRTCSVRWLHRADQEADRPVPRAKAALRASQATHWVERQEEALQERMLPLEERTAKMERRAQCGLIRDLFGDPFHPATIEPAWLDWNQGCLAKMARVIYDERKFQDLAILADALEEAGCHSLDILNHCRLPGEHARGCWVLDLLLGLT